MKNYSKRNKNKKLKKQRRKEVREDLEKTLHQLRNKHLINHSLKMMGIKINTKSFVHSLRKYIFCFKLS